MLNRSDGSGTPTCTCHGSLDYCPASPPGEQQAFALFQHVPQLLAHDGQHQRQDYQRHVCRLGILHLFVGYTDDPVLAEP
jgi:hypothetical protein